MIGIAFLAGVLIVVNVVMLFVFQRRFSVFFSAKKDKIISDMSREMRELIDEVNRQTNTDVDLIQNYLRELRALVAEADRHVAVAKAELEKLPSVPAHVSAVREQVVPASHAADRYRHYATESEQKQLTQGDLFAPEATEHPVSSPLREPTVFTTQRDGSSYAAVPVIAADVAFAENPSGATVASPKKDFSSQVRDLYRQGKTLEQIAITLGRSITEVQFALDMGA